MIHPAPRASAPRWTLGRLCLAASLFLAGAGAGWCDSPRTPTDIRDSARKVALEGTLYDYRMVDLRGLDTSVYFPFSLRTLANEVAGLLERRLSGEGRPVSTGAPLCTYHPDSSHPCENPLNAPDRWFSSRPGKNQVLPFRLWLDGSGDSLAFFDTFFFPLDTFRYLTGTTQLSPFFDQLLGQNLEIHNFGFCMELHAKVQPRPGGKLSVVGDDDTWVFVDSLLVVDMGGVHPATSRRIPLEPRGGPDAGPVSLDIFHCDRMINASTFGLSLNVPLYPADTLLEEPPVSGSLQPSSPTGSLSLKPGRQSLSIAAPAGQSWSLELRGLDGRLLRSMAGAGSDRIMWTNSGITMARLRSGGETLTERFVPSK